MNAGKHPAESLPDAYTPAQIAPLVEMAGVRKAALPVLQTLTLGILAGVFIAFGAMTFTVVVTGEALGFGVTRLLGGVAFSTGLILVVVGGAELFTGNNLIAMAWADQKITTAALLRNWSLVYAANFFGASVSVVLAKLAGVFLLGGGAVGETAARIATVKMQVPLQQAFFSGIMCNALVCLAIWLSFAARSATGKMLAIVFPISAFVTLGFEHSVANMYFIPAGMMAGASPDFYAYGTRLLAVTAGNIVGGSLGVAIVYWIIYLRPART